MRSYYFLLCCLFLLAISSASAQQDTVLHTPAVADTLRKDSAVITHLPLPSKNSITHLKTDTAKKVNPARRAALLSAVFPGAGQIYNKKYWKLPLVYGALAFPIYTFVDNLRWFNRTRYAYTTLYNMRSPQHDSTGYDNVYPQLKPFVDAGDVGGLQNYRNIFRKNVDYSVLGFIALWGLNVMDAAVDGHLKDFNVSDDLSIQIKPKISPMANTAGISIVFNIGKNHIASAPRSPRKSPIFAN